MLKKTKKILRKFGTFYVKGLNEMYAPCLKYGVNPFV